MLEPALCCGKAARKAKRLPARDATSKQNRPFLFENSHGLLLYYYQVLTEHKNLLAEHFDRVCRTETAWKVLGGWRGRRAQREGRNKATGLTNELREPV